MVSLQSNLLTSDPLLHFIPGEPVTMNAIFRQQDELGALPGSLIHLQSERLLEELQKQLEGSKLFTFAVRTPRLLEITFNEKSKTHLWQETLKQQAWQKRRCDLYRLLPGASPQCAACRRRRHQLARLYSFCTQRHLQLCASTLFVHFQYLPPGARTLPRASDQLLEKLEFGFLDFCSLL